MSQQSFLDKYLTAEWLNAMLQGLPRLLKFLRQTDPILCRLADHEWLYQNKGADQNMRLKPF
jgi:hypothetical protein